MLHEIKSIELYDLINEKRSWYEFEIYIEIEFVDLKKHRENVRKYYSKVINLINKVNKMCEQYIQQLIDMNWKITKNLILL